MNTFTVLWKDNMFSIQADKYQTEPDDGIMTFFVIDGEGKITLVASFKNWDAVIKDL